MLTVVFEANIIHWRGPSPFFFAPVPQEHGDEIRRISKLVTYGWGVIPVEAEIGVEVFRTALIPRAGSYLLPLKDVVRRSLGVTAGDAVKVALTIRGPG